MTLNPHDISELLDRLGYYIDDETGEVFIELDPCGPPTIDKFLVTLASASLVKRPHPTHKFTFILYSSNAERIFPRTTWL